MSNPITGYKVVYHMMKSIFEYDQQKLFNTRSEVRRFLITNKDIIAAYVVYEMQGNNTTSVVTQQFKV